MIKIFTQSDLIRFLYRETSEEESKEISKALEYDPDLRAMYADLKDLHRDIDTARYEPSNASVMNILGYSRSLQEKARQR